MGKSDISNISSLECRSLLDSIQNEYEQKQREDSILSKLHEDLSELIAQRNILSKRKEFNDKYCVLCCSAFNLLFKRKVCCQDCHFWVCRSCSLWDNSSKQWLCNVCEKQRVLDAESRSWICSRIKDYFGNFGAAKVLQNFCRLKKISDSENDSGYGTANDFMPLMKLLSSTSLNKDFKMAEASSHDDECEDEDDDELGDEDELAEIHHSIETILEGLLGGTLDDASVDYLFPHSSLYLNLFIEYHIKLVGAIQNLSKALQKALHNLPAVDGITPTTAHAALKSVISALVDECQDLPLLQHTEQNELLSNVSSIQGIDIFSSYDSLVAAAVINKVVEESQSKFKNSINSVEETYGIGIQKDIEQVNSDGFFKPSTSKENISIIEIGTNGFDLPVERVQIEEVEEITQEFTDSEDDKLSSISKWSNSLQNINEIGNQKQSDVDILTQIDSTNDTPTPFPEFGCDLVDNSEEKEFDSTCYPTSIASWEENWLFRRKKRLPLYSNLKYQLLTFCEEPPCMLIPQPSESGNTIDQDELSSELSETHSAGSLEFSTDSDEVQSNSLDPKISADSLQVTSKSLNAAHMKPSPVSISSEKVIADMQSEEKCHVKDSTDENVFIQKCVTVPCKLQNNHVSESRVNNVKNLEVVKKDAEQDQPPLIAMPPKPGTIAEREHKKWLNAVPLKNNPYSAENLSKRSTFSKKAILDDQISSFEEFERKLSVSSINSEPALNKLNCGPKSIDSELYKRDYYINEYFEPCGHICPLKKSEEHRYSLTDDNFDALSEEALNSLEEKVYISSGKVFTLENHIKRLEREIKDLSISEYVKSTSPSSRKIAQEVHESNVLNKNESEKIKKNRPCMKVHSLTARSLSREFRDLAKQNIPKPMNRTIPVPSYNEEGTSERESLCSPESAQSSYSAQHPDNGHGYTSDESNTSTNSIPCSKTRRHISRSILERATYWERRAEQGLLSDASVSEEFPGIEINPK